MTNREYLNTLSNEEFAKSVLKGTSKSGLDFEKWLEEGHEELKKVSLKELKAGTKFNFAGHEFTKLVDEEQSCYCLLNDTVFESKFGETNDWSKSLIRKQLNEFDKDGNSKAIKGIKKSDLEKVSLNYTAYKIPNGRSTDFITCLSYEEYWAYSFSPIDEYSWLRSGDRASTEYANGLAPSGGVSYDWVNEWLSVRPALHLKADIEIEGE